MGLKSYTVSLVLVVKKARKKPTSPPSFCAIFAGLYEQHAPTQESSGSIPEASEEYTDEDLKHLSDLEHVRKRPGMYIGDTYARGLHHLVYEVVDNSIDEAMAGFAKAVSVFVHTDNSVTVEDDGRGIPVTTHKELTAELSEKLGREVSTLEGVMTVLKFGGKFEKGAYQTSGGLHGVGVTVVNFLSQWAKAEVLRDGFTWNQEYERGVAMGPVVKGRATKKTGTKVTFKADNQIFASTKYNFDTLHKRLQELAFLNSGVHIKFLDERNGEGGDYCNTSAASSNSLSTSTGPAIRLHSDVIYIQKAPKNAFEYEIALQYSDRVLRKCSVVRQQHSHRSTAGRTSVGFSMPR